MFLAIITAYVLVLSLIKLVYLLFRPKFISSEKFGPPTSRVELFGYYIVFIFFLLLTVLQGIGVIRIEIINTGTVSLPAFNQDWNTIILVTLVGIVAASVVPFILRLFSKQRRDL